MALILIVHRVQYQSLSRRKANTKTPLLPLNLVPVYGKAGTIRLRYCERLKVCAHLPYTFGGVVAWFWRDRNNTMILNTYHLHLVEINQGVDAINRVRVTIVTGTISQIG